MRVAAALSLLTSNGNLVKRPFLLGETFGLVGFNLVGFNLVGYNKDEWEAKLR